MLTSGLFGYPLDYFVWCLLFASLIVHTWCFFRFFPRKRHAGLRLVIGNTLVFACLLGAVSLAAESYLRFVSVETDAFGMSLPARRWFALYTRLNSLGCRDKEWTVQKPHGVYRIAFVGDSYTFGWGIERVEDRFPDRLQALFDQNPAVSRRLGTAGVEVMNVAKPGWDTGAQVQPIQDMIEVYGVDEVVLGYVPNDIEKLLPRSPDFDPIRPPEPAWFNIQSSCLLDALYRRIVLPRVTTVAGYHDWLADGFTSPDIWRRHQQQLGAIIRHCHERGVTLRVALLPFLRVGGHKFQPKRLHAVLRAFFETNGVDVVDLLPVVARENRSALVVNLQDAHPNERAHALFADAIWKAFYAAPPS